MDLTDDRNFIQKHGLGLDDDDVELPNQTDDHCELLSLEPRNDNQSVPPYVPENW